MIVILRIKDVLYYQGRIVRIQPNLTRFLSGNLEFFQKNFVNKKLILSWMKRTFLFCLLPTIPLFHNNETIVISFGFPSFIVSWALDSKILLFSFFLFLFPSFNWTSDHFMVIIFLQKHNDSKNYYQLLDIAEERGEWEERTQRDYLDEV